MVTKVSREKNVLRFNFFLNLMPMVFINSPNELNMLPSNRRNWPFLGLIFGNEFSAIGKSTKPKPVS